MIRNKRRLKQLIYGFELRSIASIVNGLAQRLPKKVISSQIKKDLASLSTRIGLNDAEKNYLWTRIQSWYVKVSRKVFSSLRTSIYKPTKFREKEFSDEEKLRIRRAEVYKAVRSTVLEHAERIKNEMANDIEHREKREKLDSLMEKGVFFLCSAHAKPAKDHKDWQGTVYIDENWKEKVQDETVCKRIEAYIRNRKIRTIQWVIGPPVYMMTRPNCKHFFRSVSVKEVLGSSSKSLLKLYDMNIKNQEPLSYEKTVYIGYYEQLKSLKYLNQLCPNEELGNDLKRTRRLANHWRLRANSEAS